MLSILLAAAVLGQDGGLTPEDLKKMELQWKGIAAARAKEDGLAARQQRPAKTLANGPPIVSVARTGPLRGPRPSYNRPLRVIGWNPPQVMPRSYTVPAFVRR